jgi:aryl-alcohol dehydrogenase-like predicted oxidoreductase
MTSPLVLGAMMFGTAIDEPTSFALLDRFVEAGGEWIDTADCYSFWADDSGHGGASEALLGRWFAARPGVRERVKIAT